MGKIVFSITDLCCAHQCSVFINLDRQAVGSSSLRWHTALTALHEGVLGLVDLAARSSATIIRTIKIASRSTVSNDWKLISVIGYRQTFFLPAKTRLRGIPLNTLRRSRCECCGSDWDPYAGVIECFFPISSFYASSTQLQRATSQLKVDRVVT